MTCAKGFSWENSEKVGGGVRMCGPRAVPGNQQGWQGAPSRCPAAAGMFFSRPRSSNLSCIRITYRACENTDSIPSVSLIQQVQGWGGGGKNVHF